MATWRVHLVGLMLLAALLIWGCGSTPTAAPTVPAEVGTGTLEFRANGEDFVRQGFVTSDGWDIRFDHLYVTLANLMAYQSDPPFDADTGGMPQAAVQVSLEQPTTVDLAAGDAQAAPVLVGTVEAAAGRYNALAWELVRAPDGLADGAVILMEGRATKDDVTLPFRISLDEESSYVCGDFVGDERKGILQAGETADLEATFHFDHLFGDGSAPPDADINTGALGFEPFAALAQDGMVDVDMAALQAGLSAEDYAKLTAMHLAHVGEGHCRNTHES